MTTISDRTPDSYDSSIKHSSSTSSTNFTLYTAPTNSRFIGQLIVDNNAFPGMTFKYLIGGVTLGDFINNSDDTQSIARDIQIGYGKSVQILVYGSTGVTLRYTALGITRSRKISNT